jgi:hypothetical protein
MLSGWLPRPIQQEELADRMSFILWQIGVPEFQLEERDSG